MTARVIPISEGHRIREKRRASDVRAADIAMLGAICFWPLSIAWFVGLAFFEGVREGQG